MNWPALVLLITFLFGLAWSTIRSRTAFKQFQQLADTAARQRYFRRIIRGGVLIFGLGSLLGLGLLGRLDAVARPPEEFNDLAAAIWRVVPPHLFDDPMLRWGLAAEAAIAVAVVVWRMRRKPKRPSVLGPSVQALAPRNRIEALYVTVVSLDAGITEELFFRLLLPLLFTLVTGQALLAFVLASLVFGLVHIYQGWLGVAATTVYGALFTLIYLWSWNLWAPMAVHAAIDLLVLVVRPSLGRRPKPQRA